jgi:hypothetical protein
MNTHPEHQAIIKLEFASDENFDGLPEHTVEFCTDFTDMTAHGWFALFEKSHGCAGLFRAQHHACRRRLSVPRGSLDRGYA